MKFTQMEQLIVRVSNSGLFIFLMLYLREIPNNSELFQSVEDLTLGIYPMHGFAGFAQKLLQLLTTKCHYMVRVVTDKYLIHNM